MATWRVVLMTLVAVTVVVLGIDDLMSGDTAWGWFCVVGGLLFGAAVLVMKYKSSD